MLSLKSDALFHVLDSFDHDHSLEIGSIKKVEENVCYIYYFIT